MINYEVLNNQLFGGKIKQSHKDGIENILEAWTLCKSNDLRHLGYILATAYHETAGTMQPVKERGGEIYLRRKPYWPFFGRGYAQLTWAGNYKKIIKMYGVDAVANPDVVLEPKISARIIVDFMERGLFTGKRLSHYFNDSTDDPRQARRVVNILDCADKIAEYYKIFYRSLV